MKDDTMRTEQLRPDETRLTEALHREAEQLTPSADGLDAVLARLTTEPGQVLSFEAARRRHRRRTGIVAGTVAIGLAAAATVFAVGGGLRHDSTPQPVQTPTAPATATAPGDYEPPVPAVTRTVYWVGDDPSRAGEQPMLFTEEVRNLPPYAPRQALDALFTDRPIGDYSDLYSRGNVVTSTTETDRDLVVDLSAVDRTSRPTGTADPAAVAAVWVQGWVDTIQDAYSSEKPVLFTLKGRPTQLYGYVDTSKPIGRDPQVKVTEARGIYLPRPGERVTSPIDLAFDVPDGSYRWRMTDLDTGRVIDDIPGMEGAGAASIGAVDLPAGRYRAELSEEPDSSTKRFRRTVEFTVTGDATPTASPTPVTDPPTSPVAVTPVVRADADGRGLIQEWQPRSTAMDAVQHLFDGVTGVDGATRNWRGAKVRAVTQTPDAIDVDLSAGPTRATLSAGLTRLELQALARTANGFYASDLPVRLTLNGRPVSLWGDAASGAAIRLGSPAPRQPNGVYSPVSESTVAGRVAIVGGVRDADSAARWYVADGVTNVPLFQGQATVDTVTRTYAFSVALPPGRYAAEVETHGPHEDSYRYLVAFTVT